jgi:hypothetical protein
MKSTPESLTNSDKPPEANKKDPEAAQEAPTKHPVRIRITTLPNYKPNCKQ